MIWLWLVLLVVSGTALVVFSLMMFRRNGLMLRLPLGERILYQVGLLGLAILVGHSLARITQIIF